MTSPCNRPSPDKKHHRRASSNWLGVQVSRTFLKVPICSSSSDFCVSCARCCSFKTQFNICACLPNWCNCRWRESKTSRPTMRCCSWRSGSARRSCNSQTERLCTTLVGTKILLMMWWGRFGKASGLAWTRGTVCTCAQRPLVVTFQGSMGRMASSFSCFSRRSRWWLQTTCRPTPFVSAETLKACALIGLHLLQQKVKPGPVMWRQDSPISPEWVSSCSAIETSFGCDVYEHNTKPCMKNRVVEGGCGR